MRFSELFNINREDDDDWFDTILVFDTKLFVDPFLIYAQEYGCFCGSHREVISFFNDAFTLVAKTNGDEKHLFWKKAQSILLFPEVEELCLGYTKQSTGGSGSGKGYSKNITSALWESIDAGITELKHFEEVGILRTGIGADMISDITVNLLRNQFTEYTQNVCKRHDIPTELIKVKHGVYNNQFQRWMPYEAKLPINPYNGMGILLSPLKYLRTLPTVSAEDFWDYCYENENETLRNDFGIDVAKNVDKETIVGFARKHPNIRQDYINKLETEEPVPYDYKHDRKGIIQWYEATNKYCTQHPENLFFDNEEAFVNFIENILEVFRNYVENNGGWGLLWNDNKTAKSESAAQKLFQGIVMHYCRANNIDISKEVNIGRGPVDFKVSQGYQFRALIELKLAKNTKFWNGLEKQLPKYQEAENTKIGYFVVIVFSEKDAKKLADIQSRVKVVNDATQYKIKAFTIDAELAPPSASNL